MPLAGPLSKPARHGQNVPCRLSCGFGDVCPRCIAPRAAHPSKVHRETSLRGTKGKSEEENNTIHSFVISLI
jgi:hypothetical protein